MAARTLNRRDRARGFYGALLVAIVCALAGAAALVNGPRVFAMDPTQHVYAATVWILVGWTAVHVALGVLMLLYCTARRLAGRMTPHYDVDMATVTLYWHFCALTVAITVIVVAGFPLVA